MNATTRNKAKKEAATAMRFAVIGVINTIVGCSIMFGLYNLAGCGYWLSSAANFTLTSILSYVLNKKYTFRHYGDIKGSAVRFAINIAVCYFLAYGIAKPLTMHLMSSFVASMGHASSLALKENVAMAVGLVLFTVFNYLGQRLFVFREKKYRAKK